MNYIVAMLFSAAFFLCQFADAQVFERGATYTSEIDRGLSIRYLSVFPTTDNVGGIYSRPIEDEIVKLVQNHHRWDYRSANFVGPVPILTELEQNPAQILRMTTGSEADAIVMAQIIKGPQGVSMRMNLFQTSNGLLLAQTFLRNHKRTNIPDIRKQTAKLFDKLMNKIPYQGLILSRQNNRVTINVGALDGLKATDTLSAIQIIGVDRHPKFNFLVQSHKEILGKIKIVKVEDTLSFGMVTYEREKGVVKTGTKLSGLQQVNYTVTEDLTDTTGNNLVAGRKLKNDVVFGKNATEWKPVTPPTFGQVGLKLGLGNLTNNATLTSSGSLSASASFYPQIGLSGELWINPKWTARFNWEQGIASTENPQAGASPESLSHSLSAFSFLIGYNFLLQKHFFGPKVEVGLGFSSYSDSVDDSDPEGLTSFSYSGLTLSLRGSMPLTPTGKWNGGIGLNMLLGPSVTETPVTSGSEASGTVNDFYVMGSYKYSVNLRLVADLTFRLTRTNFTGTGTRTSGESATTASQQMTLLNGGIIYMF